MNEPIWRRRPPVACGVGFWNHRSVAGLMRNAAAPPVFHRQFDRALAESKRTNGCLIGWASRITDEQARACKAADIPLVRIEDGFLRSVGLGAGLAPAASLVLDQRGIYYDASVPSDLEWMLGNRELDDRQRARGADLRRRILHARVSKYNTGGELATDSFPADRPIVLVPGQVADDAAILKTRSDSIDLQGCENINLELLKTVRRNNPDACIVYKPHPDVASDLRKGRIRPSRAMQYADRVISNVDIIQLIEKCDRVETLTSLTGFEALLRGKPVVTHGLPFYAGWGLTQDHTRIARRSRIRSIEELVYLCFVDYIQCVNPVTYAPCQPEELIAVLQRLRKSRTHRVKNALRWPVAWLGEKINGAG